MSSAERSAPGWVATLCSVLAAAALLSGGGCLGPSAGDAPGPLPSGEPAAPALPPGGNVMSVTVNGSLCGLPSFQYANEPCVSVTFCVPGGTGGTQCQTLNNILLDTGSFGLRVFKSAVTLPLAPVRAAGGGTLAECAQFGDGSSEWGPVAMADVYLAGEGAATVPIMLIDPTYATPAAPCTAGQSRPDTSPAQTGFNGILGVGVFAQDCGPACATEAFNGQYYACNGATCGPSVALITPVNQQVTNPVSALPLGADGVSDSNGVILSLPAVAPSGAASLEGSLYLGIGTRANNAPGSVTVLTASENAELSTDFAAYGPDSIPGFLDSGSSVLFFPPPSDAALLPDCDSGAGGGYGALYKGFYCPPSPQALSATNAAATGSTRSTVSFEVDNAYALLQSGNRVFGTMADSATIGSDTVFDWGLPFFYGRSVVVGLEGTVSPLCVGVCAEPYWAY